MNAAKSPAQPAEERDGFRFRGGHTGIDLTATLQARLSPVPRELLQTPHDLARWLVAADMIAAAPDTNATDLIQARSLREAIYALAHATLSDGPPPTEARAILNMIAVGPSAVPHLTAAGTVALVGSTATLLVTLARDAIRLFGGAAASHIGQCQSPTCTLFFVDTSRSGDRRWCSMAGCGNRAKVADFRRRQRETRGGPV